MTSALRRFVVVGILAVVLDQAIKALILGGFRWESPCVSIVFTLNTGVAFSLLASLGGALKYLQILLILGALLLAWRQQWIAQHPIALGLILFSGASNVADRFIHGGVVDMVAWHCGFEFAIFNGADALINLGVGLLIVDAFRQHKAASA